MALGILAAMTEDTWHNRDLPVLKAVVARYEQTGRGPRPAALEAATAFDGETVQRALRALYREPYFEKGQKNAGGDILIVGAPTSAALRIAGQWPTPEGQLERLIAAFEAVAADEARPEEERSRAAKLGLWLTGTLSQVAIGALGGAGGNLMTGG